MRRPRALFFRLALLGLLLLAGGGVATAQPSPSLDTTPHPAHVHQGTCAQLNPNPQYQLNPVTQPKSATTGGKPPTPPPAQGVLTAPPVLYSDTQINVKLAVLLSSAHAINIYQSAAQIQTAIGCGDLGGQLINDRLLVALQPSRGSGYSGVAVLQKQGDKTEVTLYLLPPSSPAPAATPTS